uniref:small monomeric GTPase n=1 Tax=Crocodylus porosus TaxID=8502 RepID=A0A7M4E2T7_CROPO
PCPRPPPGRAGCSSPRSPSRKGTCKGQRKGRGGKDASLSPPPAVAPSSLVRLDLFSRISLPGQKGVLKGREYHRDVLLTGVMLLGDSGVGKTCFLVQFKDGAFLSGTFIATVGIDFRFFTGAISLQIWDTAGQERFRSVTHAYYRDAQALLLLYDITSKMSFDNIRAWLSEIYEYAQKDVVIMLLGNKVRVASCRVTETAHDATSSLQEYGVPFMETSAKTGMNVELAFLAIAKELKERAVQQPDEPRFQIHDYIESQKKKSSCCAFI